MPLLHRDVVTAFFAGCFYGGLATFLCVGVVKAWRSR
jgi:hypothetical protein